MLELAPNDPLIKTYLKDLQHLKSQSVTHELGLKGPFQTLLDKAAKRRGCRFQMLELAPNDPLIKTYLKDLQHLKSQSVTHELGLKGTISNPVR